MPDHVKQPASSTPPSTSPPPHVIRLLGPWEGWRCDVQDSDGQTIGRPDRVKVPLQFDGWLPSDFCGTVTLERAFGLPTNLDADQATDIVVQSHGLVMESASLNGEQLTIVSSDTAGTRLNARPWLQARNRLRLTLHIADVAAADLLEARLEIANG